MSNIRRFMLLVAFSSAFLASNQVSADTAPGAVASAAMAVERAPGDPSAWLPGDAQPGTLAPPAPPRPRVPALQTGAPSSAAPAGADIAAPPPPLNLLSGKDSTLTAREAANVATARQWIDGRSSGDLGAQGENGSVVFRFGSVLPSVVCAPLYVCVIELEPGEWVNNNGVHLGDKVRWKVEPALSGEGANARTNLVIKTTDTGLTTNMLVVTNRRAYKIKLVSRKDDWMPSVSFSYPEDEAAAWAALESQRQQHEAATVMPETGQSLDALDFAYSIDGDKPVWRPVRVYSDGVKTYVQFPASMAADEAPALVALGDKDREQLVNYRVSGDRYVVDKVLQRALLVVGVGRSATKVFIEHEGSN